MTDIENQEVLLETEIVDTEAINIFTQNFKFKEGYEFKEVGTAGRYDNYDKSAAESLGKIVIQMTKIQDIEKQIETEALERAQTEYKKADLARTKYEALEKAQKEYEKAQSKYEEALMQEQALGQAQDQAYQALEQAQNEALKQAQDQAYQAYQASGQAQDQYQALKQAQDKAQEEYRQVQEEYGQAQSKYQEALGQKRTQYEALERAQDEVLEQDQYEAQSTYEEVLGAQYRVQNEALGELKQEQYEAQEEYEQAQEEYEQAQARYLQEAFEVQEAFEEAQQAQYQASEQDQNEAQAKYKEAFEAQYQLKHQADKALIKVNQVKGKYEILLKQAQKLEQVEVLKLAQVKYKIASEQAQVKYKEAFETLQEESKTTLEEAQTNIQKAIQKFYTDKDTSLTMDGNTDVFFHNAKYYTGDEPQKFQTILTNAFKNMQLMKSEDPLLQKIGQSYTKPSKQKELFEKQMKTQIEEQTKKANRETINNLLDIAELKVNESGGYSGYQSNFKAVRDSNVKEDAGIQNRLGGNYDKDALRVVDLTLINDSQKKLSQDTFNKIMDLKGPGFADIIIYTASYRNNTNIDSLKQFQEYFIQYEKSKTNEGLAADSVTDSSLYKYAKYKTKFEILLLDNTLKALEERLDKQEQQLYPEVATIKEDLGLDKSCTVIEAMNLAVLQYETERQDYAKKQLSEEYSQEHRQIYQEYLENVERFQKEYSENTEKFQEENNKIYQEYLKNAERLQKNYSEKAEQFQKKYSKDFDNSNAEAFNQYEKNKSHINEYLDIKAKRSLKNANLKGDELTAQVGIERKKLDKNLVEQISKMSKTTSMSNDEFYKLTEQMKTNISDDVKLLRTLDEALLTKITGNTNFVNNNRDLYYYGNDSIEHNLDASKIVMYEFLKIQTTDESLKNEYDEKAKNILETIKGKDQDKFLKIVAREASRMKNITLEQQTNFNTQMEAFFKNNLTNGIENKIYTSAQTKKNTKEIKSLTKEIETKTKEVYFNKENEKLFEQVGVKTTVMFSKKKPINIKKDLDEKYANCSLKKEFYSEILKLQTSLPARFNAEHSEIQKLLNKMKQNAESKEQKAAFNIFEKEIKSMGSIARDKVKNLQESNNIIITAINNINNKVTSATQKQQTRKDRLEGKKTISGIDNDFIDKFNADATVNKGRTIHKSENGQLPKITVNAEDQKNLDEISLITKNPAALGLVGTEFGVQLAFTPEELKKWEEEDLSKLDEKIEQRVTDIALLKVIKPGLTTEEFNEYIQDPEKCIAAIMPKDGLTQEQKQQFEISIQQLNSTFPDKKFDAKKILATAMERVQAQAQLMKESVQVIRQYQQQIERSEHDSLGSSSEYNSQHFSNNTFNVADRFPFQKSLSQTQNDIISLNQPSRYDHRGSTKPRYILPNQEIRNDEYDIDVKSAEKDSFDNEQNELQQDDINEEYNINHSLSSMSNFSNLIPSQKSLSFSDRENLKLQTNSGMGVRGGK